MNAKTEVTIKGIKEMSQEASAWESRKAGLVGDVENLRRIKEQAEVEIQTMKNVATQDIAQKLLKARQEQAAVDESRNKLEADKKDFEVILKTFQRDQSKLEALKSDLEMVKNEYTARMEKAKAFILLVKRESEGL